MTKHPVCFIAHRGYSSKYQMNTEEAFLGAIAHGSGGIETDVHFTSDGVLVVNHNREVRYADGTELLIAEHTYEELTEKPLANDHTETEQYLCTFRRYLEICREGKMIAFIEFKGIFPDDRIRAALDMAKEVYDLSMCSLQSFHFDNLLRAHAMYPELGIMYTCGTHDETVDRCLELGFDIDMAYGGIDDETVRQFHARGLKVGLWTANTAEAMEFCLARGVDYIESDVFSGMEITEDGMHVKTEIE